MIQSIGFYGFGTLAKTLYLGFNDLLIQNNIALSIHTRSRPSDRFADLKYVGQDTLLTISDIIIIAVKPQQLMDIMPALTRIDWHDKCLVSLLAGVPLTQFTNSLKNLRHAFRVMPNTSAQFKESMTTFSLLPSTHSSYETCIISLFSSIGSIVKVDESQLDFCTALCGSGPAFLYKLLLNMIELAENEGIPSDQARLMINQLIQGLASSLHQRPDDLDTLITEICSPNGTTEAGLEAFSQQNLSDQWKHVFLMAKKRSIALSKEIKSV